MMNIKAFVGYSFTDDDAQLVASFLKIFDQIKAALPSFDWTHAKQAEPEELAKKVLRLVEDCNTFIGICTKKELVTHHEAISSRIFHSKSSIISNDQLGWKTSDWIIQEIGMAVGRSMSLVILLEEGCRRPGGLQGDIEFIPFNRSAPEKAFGQILEMVRAISPPVGSGVEQSFDGDTENEPVKAQDSDVKSELDDADVPKIDWALGDYKSAFFWKVLKKDEVGAEKIRNAFYASNLAATEENKAEWDATCEEWQLRFSDKGSVDKLNGLNAKFPENLSITQSYASALAYYSHHEESAQLYENASKLESTKADRVQNTIEAAIEYLRAERSDKALKMLEDAKTLGKDDAELSYQLAYGIKRYAEEIKNEELKIEALERLVWLKPDDDSNRFDLAYAHSEAGNSDMALHHYLAVPWSRRSVSVWNNLGVSYQHFSAPARAVEAYQKASDGGNSLAMSNLAYRYLNNGFVREAREQLDRAMGTEEPHKNVNEAYALLSETKEKETKSVDEILDSTKKKIEIFKRLSQAICEPDIISLESIWVSPDCELTVSLDGRKFEARGRYEVKNVLSGLLGSSKDTVYEIILTGELFGQRIFGEIERKALSATATTILGQAGQQKKPFALVFDQCFQSAEVIEAIDTRHPRSYEINVKRGIGGLAAS